MKHLCLILSAVFLAPASLAPASLAPVVEKMYYVGEAKLSSPTGQPRGSQAFLLEKIHDPDKSMIIERAIVVKPDHTVEEHTMTMLVKGDTFTISDAGKTIEGTGKLFGPAWKWTYFKATYQSTNGAKIEDKNFLSDPSAGVARKKSPPRMAPSCCSWTSR